MHSFLDAKAMAKVLRQSLVARGVAVTHAECLEMVARQFGLANWNTLAAQIQAAQAGCDALPLPRGWSVTRQTEQRFYRLGLDPAEPGTALIESRVGRNGVNDLNGHFAVLMQSVAAGPFHGQRLRLSASLRTQDADGGALWMRVDRAPGDVLRFDNMMQRRKHGPLRGTAGWTGRSIVLDVAEDASSVHFGFLLQGYGSVRARALKLEAVGPDIPPTAGWGSWLPEPENLDFVQEETVDA